jgi:hypothetical protein
MVNYRDEIKIVKIEKVDTMPGPSHFKRDRQCPLVEVPGQPHSSYCSDDVGFHRGCVSPNEQKP